MLNEERLIFYFFVRHLALWGRRGMKGFLWGNLKEREKRDV